MRRCSSQTRVLASPAMAHGGAGILHRRGTRRQNNGAPWLHHLSLAQASERPGSGGGAWEANDGWDEWGDLTGITPEGPGTNDGRGERAALQSQPPPQSSSSSSKIPGKSSVNVKRGPSKAQAAAPSGFSEDLHERSQESAHAQEAAPASSSGGLYEGSVDFITGQQHSNVQVIHSCCSSPLCKQTIGMVACGCMHKPGLPTRTV